MGPSSLNFISLFGWASYGSTFVMDPGTDFAECETQRGPDGHGIPAPMLHDVGRALKEKGVEVLFQRPAPGSARENQWRPLSDADAFYQLVRTWNPTGLRLRVFGPDREAVCSQLRSLLDQGDSACLLRAGFVEVPFGRRLERVDPFAWDEFTKRLVPLGEKAIYWRLQRSAGAGPGACSWKATIDVRFGDRREAECQAYCLDPAVADEVRDAAGRLPCDNLYDPDESPNDTGEVRSDGERAWEGVVVTNPLGLHNRPSHEFATLARRFQAKVFVESESHLVDGRSAFDLLMLVAVPGTRLLV